MSNESKEPRDRERPAEPLATDVPGDMGEALARVWRKVEAMPPDPVEASKASRDVSSPRRHEPPREPTPADLGISPRYRRARLADFSAGDFAHGDWLLSDPPPQPQDVFICGGNGVGKTHLAAALAKRWQARWCTTLKLMRRIRRTFKPSVKETEDQVIDELTDPRRLVLDDISACSLTDFGLATVLGLLEERHTHNRVTIVTCYHSLKMLDGLDTSLASRLSAFARVTLVGDDRRLGGA